MVLFSLSRCLNVGSSTIFYSVYILIIITVRLWIEWTQIVCEDWL